MRADNVAGRRTPIVAAFVANVGIAIAKFIGFAVTGSASMFAEGIHSIADTADQALLLVGDRRGHRRATSTHPFGYGRETYFWSFIVALVLFSGGGLFALVEAEEKLRHPPEIESAGWALAILAIAATLDGLSLRTAIRHARRHGRATSWWRYIRESKRAELPVVLLEDTGALVGLGFAAIGVVLTDVTGNSRFDALGSLGIGLLLVTMASLLAAEMKSLLLGEAASDHDVTAVRRVITGHPNVADVVDLRTMQLSPDTVLVAARLALRDATHAVPTIATVDADIRTAVSCRTVCFLNPVMSDRTPTEDH